MILSIFALVSAFAFTNAATFTNPLGFGADPWVIQYQGFYYYCYSGYDRIVVSKSKKLQGIMNGTQITVFTPPKDGPYSKHVWAPELHYLSNKWYIYFAADDGNDAHHRMYVLESDSPQGKYVMKGKITDKSDKRAIDGTVMQSNKQLYFVWSGWVDDKGPRQDLYIAKMSNPWTIVGERVLISVPTYTWEKLPKPNPPIGINEGPEAIINGKKHYLIYSAGGGDDYCLGSLLCEDPTRLMDPKCWKKEPNPVFYKAETAYGPGHASFTKSPDKKQNWIVFHACEKKGGGWGNRSVRIQQFIIRGGVPNFGRPIKCHVPINEPSGS